MSDSTSSHSRLSYQPGLDGLRAVAVLAVMLFHTGVASFSGGLLGVDLFFVLSGFLITTLLVREVQGSGGLSFGDFYTRRLRRLFPAMGLLLVGIALQARLTHVNPLLGSSVRGDSFATLFYFANWHFIFAHASYFAQFAPPSPLRHVWSLAVEEQWYLLWPPLLLVLLRVTKRNLPAITAVLVALALASAAWMSHLAPHLADPSRAYYGTDSRAHTLLVGSALALLLHRFPVRRSRARQAADGVGLLALAACFLAFTRVHGFDEILYRGGFLVFAVVGALVVLGVMSQPRGVLSRLLSVPPLPWIGQISYGLYLWHWPIAVWINPAQSHFKGLGLLAVRFSLAFAAATASFYLVERPIRRAKWNRLGVPRLATAGMAVVTSGLLAIVISLPTPEPTVVLRGAGSHRRPPAADRPDDLRVLVAGDSVGWSMSYIAGKQDGFRIYSGTGLGCGVLPGHMMLNGQAFFQPGVPPCATQRDAWRQISASHPQLVLFPIGAWEVYDHIVGNRVLRVGTAAYRADLTDGLNSDLDYLHSLMPAPILLLPVPCMSQKVFDLGEGPDPRNDASKAAWVNGVLRDVVAQRHDNVHILDWTPFLCPGGHFLKTLKGIPLRPDGVHFTTQSAPLVWDWLRPRLEQYRS